MFLLIKMDSEEGLVCLYNNKKECQAIRKFKAWPLTTNLAKEVESLLLDAKLEWKDLQGIGVFAGPGSFSSLRVSHAWSNALAYSLDLPIANAGSDDWQQACLDKLINNHRSIVIPFYGRPPNITQRKK